MAHRVLSSPFSSQLLSAALLLVCVAYLVGMATHVHAKAFQLFGQSWQPGVIQITKQGWQHVYICHHCRLTPSLTVLTSTESVPDSSLFHELERAYDDIVIESDVSRGQQNFTLVRATSPLSPASPKRLTAVLTRYQSLRPGLWHFAQAVIESDNENEGDIAESLWLNLLGHASLDRHNLMIFPQDTTVVVDISSPDRNWFSDFVEQVGVDKLILGSTITTAGLLLLGAQVALGAANVRGPCGKPIGQCPCTRSALRAAGLPAP